MIVVYVLGGIVGAFVLLLIGMRIAMVSKAKKLEGQSVPQLRGKHGKWIKKGKGTILYFHRPGCRACTEMTKHVKDMQKNTDGVFSLDISNDMETAQKLGILATPTTVLIKDGVVQKCLIGPQPTSNLAAFL